MARLNFSISTFAFVIIALNQVHGLLNITNEAIVVGRKLAEEVKKEWIYIEYDDAVGHVKQILKDIIKPFHKLVKIHEQNAFEAYLLYIKEDKCLNNASFFDYASLVNDKKENFERLFVKDNIFYLSPPQFDRLKIYANSQAKIGNKTITELMNSMHTAVTTSCQSRLIEIFNNRTQDCNFVSHQHLFYDTIQHISLLDAEYYVASQFARACLKIAFDAYSSDEESIKHNVDRFKKNWNISLDMIELMKMAEPKFIKRNFKSLNFYKSTLKNKKLDTWLCNDSEEIATSFKVKAQDISFTQLNLFKRYIANEVNLNPDGTCVHDCPYFKSTKVYGCFDKEVCNDQKQCNGKILDCSQNIDKAQICFSDDSSRYYNGIVLHGLKHEYRKEECKENKVLIKSWQRGLTQCSYCMCTCETNESESERYVNLRPVTSNVESNYVVTGVRFTKWNNILHIQIQEGKLLTDGITNLREWKNIDDYTTKDINVTENIDYHVISWDKGRTVALDKLHAPGNKALTGLRFKYSDDDLLKLEIQVTQFNFRTGQLDPNTSYWFSNDAGIGYRSEFNLDNMKEDEDTVYNLDHFFKFTTSLKYDAGQNTIPFIGIIPFSPRTSGPMSGAGLYIKNVYDLGPTLGLHLLTFDVEPYVN